MALARTDSGDESVQHVALADSVERPDAGRDGSSSMLAAGDGGRGVLRAASASWRCARRSRRLSAMATPASPTLSAAQLARLGAVGEMRRAPAGEVLYRIGDRGYPFIAILEGEVAIVDAGGQGDPAPRIVRVPRRDEPAHGSDRLRDGGRDGAVALRAVDGTRCASCCSRTGRSATSCSPRSWSGARRSEVHGVGLEIVGPRSSEATMRMLAFARSNHLPTPGRTPRRTGRRASRRSCGCPVGASSGLRRSGSCLARSASGASSLRGRRSTSSSSAAGRLASAPRCTAPPRASRRSSSSARPSAGRRARRGASRTTSASRRAYRARS